MQRMARNILRNRFVLFGQEYLASVSSKFLLSLSGTFTRDTTLSSGCSVKSKNQQITRSSRNLPVSDNRKTKAGQLKSQSDNSLSKDILENYSIFLNITPSRSYSTLTLTTECECGQGYANASKKEKASCGSSYLLSKNKRLEIDEEMVKNFVLSENIISDYKLFNLTSNYLLGISGGSSGWKSCNKSKQYGKSMPRLMASDTGGAMENCSAFVDKLKSDVQNTVQCQARRLRETVNDRCVHNTSKTTQNAVRTTTSLTEEPQEVASNEFGEDMPYAGYDSTSNFEQMMPTYNWDSRITHCEDPPFSDPENMRQNKRGMKEIPVQGEWNSIPSVVENAANIMVAAGPREPHFKSNEGHRKKFNSIKSKKYHATPPKITFVQVFENEKFVGLSPVNHSLMKILGLKEFSNPNPNKTSVYAIVQEIPELKDLSFMNGREFKCSGPFGVAPADYFVILGDYNCMIGFASVDRIRRAACTKKEPPGQDDMFKNLIIGCVIPPGRAKTEERQIEKKHTEQYDYTNSAMNWVISPYLPLKASRKCGAKKPHSKGLFKGEISKARCEDMYAYLSRPGRLTKKPRYTPIMECYEITYSDSGPHSRAMGPKGSPIDPSMLGLLSSGMVSARSKGGSEELPGKSRPKTYSNIRSECTYSTANNRISCTCDCNCDSAHYLMLDIPKNSESDKSEDKPESKDIDVSSTQIEVDASQSDNRDMEDTIGITKLAPSLSLVDLNPKKTMKKNNKTKRDEKQSFANLLDDNHEKINEEVEYPPDPTHSNTASVETLSTEDWFKYGDSSKNLQSNRLPQELNISDDSGTTMKNMIMPPPTKMHRYVYGYPPLPLACPIRCCSPLQYHPNQIPNPFGPRYAGLQFGAAPDMFKEHGLDPYVPITEIGYEGDHRPHQGYRRSFSEEMALRHRQLYAMRPPSTEMSTTSSDGRPWHRQRSGPYYYSSNAESTSEFTAAHPHCEHHHSTTGSSDGRPWYAGRPVRYHPSSIGRPIAFVAGRPNGAWGPHHSSSSDQFSSTHESTVPTNGRPWHGNGSSQHSNSSNESTTGFKGVWYGDGAWGPHHSSSSDCSPEGTTWYAGRPPPHHQNSNAGGTTLSSSSDHSSGGATAISSEDRLWYTESPIPYHSNSRPIAITPVQPWYGNGAWRPHNSSSIDESSTSYGTTTGTTVVPLWYVERPIPLYRSSERGPIILAVGQDWYPGAASSEIRLEDGTTYKFADGQPWHTERPSTAVSSATPWGPPYHNYARYAFEQPSYTGNSSSSEMSTTSSSGSDSQNNSSVRTIQSSPGEYSPWNRPSRALPTSNAMSSGPSSNTSSNTSYESTGMHEPWAPPTTTVCTNSSSPSHAGFWGWMAGRLPQQNTTTNNTFRGSTTKCWPWNMFRQGRVPTEMSSAPSADNISSDSSSSYGSIGTIRGSESMDDSTIMSYNDNESSKSTETYMQRTAPIFGKAGRFANYDPHRHLRDQHHSTSSTVPYDYPPYCGDGLIQFPGCQFSASPTDRGEHHSTRRSVPDGSTINKPVSQSIGWNGERCCCMWPCNLRCPIPPTVPPGGGFYHSSPVRPNLSTGSECSESSYPSTESDSQPSYSIGFDDTSLNSCTDDPSTQSSTDYQLQQDGARNPLFKGSFPCPTCQTSMEYEPYNEPKQNGPQSFVKPGKHYPYPYHYPFQFCHGPTGFLSPIYTTNSEIEGKTTSSTESNETADSESSDNSTSSYYNSPIETLQSLPTIGRRSYANVSYTQHSPRCHHLILFNRVNSRRTRKRSLISNIGEPRLYKIMTTVKVKHPRGTTKPYYCECFHFAERTESSSPTACHCSCDHDDVNQLLGEVPSTRPSINNSKLLPPPSIPSEASFESFDVGNFLIGSFDVDDLFQWDPIMVSCMCGVMPPLPPPPPPSKDDDKNSGVTLDRVSSDHTSSSRKVSPTGVSLQGRLDFNRNTDLCDSISCSESTQPDEYQPVARIPRKDAQLPHFSAFRSVESELKKADRNDVPQMKYYEAGLYKILAELGITELNKGSYAGEWIGSGSIIPAIDPAIGCKIVDVVLPNCEEIEHCMQVAKQASASWRHLQAPCRGVVLREIAYRLRRKRESLAKLVSLEVGKVMLDAMCEVNGTINMFDYAAGLASVLPGNVFESERPNHVILERFFPMGLTGIISAFNTPFSTFGRSAAISLAVGNSVIYKPAATATLSSIALMKIIGSVFKKMNFPPVVTCVQGHGDVGQLFAEDPRIDILVFSGNARNGHDIGMRVQNRFGKSLLNLTGNNGMIVNHDADFELAIKAATLGIVDFAGQKKQKISRIIVHRNLYDQFVAELVKMIEKVRNFCGHPLDPKTIFGPLHTQQIVKEYMEAVQKARNDGGKIETGGQVLFGNFVQPTIVTNIKRDSELMTYPIMGPIAFVMPASDMEDALEQNNSYLNCLQSSVFSKNVGDILRFIGEDGLSGGVISVNTANTGSELTVPFGGDRTAGGGRLSGSNVWREYCRRVAVTINFSSSLPYANGSGCTLIDKFKIY